ncbi:MAG TPA: 6-phosphofructokinase [Clostridiales bacterium]|nr:6-phosphofructokinase [Clostridiales bacterium]
MKIGIITSGGDAPGMNACIRAVVRYALSCGAEVVGFYRGYQGILDDDCAELRRFSVSNIIREGGTFLQTDRCEKFLEKKYRVKAAENLRAKGVEDLVVIGGDGSFSGALALAEDTGIKVYGIPGTIDNDLAYTEKTLGFDTAVNTVIGAINNLRDTMQSHNKVTFVEVMGRSCGDIALHAGITGGAEYILVPEIPFDMNKIAKNIAESADKGKKSNLVVVAEGAGRMETLCEEFEKLSEIKPRQTRLGFIQRGGSPTYFDRFLACEFGIQTVKNVLSGNADTVVGLSRGEIVSVPIKEALSMKKKFNERLYKDAVLLT